MIKKPPLYPAPQLGAETTLGLCPPGELAEAHREPLCGEAPFQPNGLETHSPSCISPDPRCPSPENVCSLWTQDSLPHPATWSGEGPPPQREQCLSCQLGGGGARLGGRIQRNTPVSRSVRCRAKSKPPLRMRRPQGDHRAARTASLCRE